MSTSTAIPPTFRDTITEDAERRRVLVTLDEAGKAAVRGAQEMAATMAQIWGIRYDTALAAVRAGVDTGNEAAVLAFAAEEFERQGDAARAACRDELVAATDERVPPRFAGATVTEPRIADWLGVVIAQARQSARVPGVDFVTGGPSLLISGPTGTGKTHQAYGVVRALAAASVRAQWILTTAADFYGALRPRAGIDSETEFRRFANARLLILDDLGAAKPSDWTEEQDYRLINTRYEAKAATIITTNLQPRDIPEKFGQRVASRLNEMCTPVPIVGPDRRRAQPREVP